MLEHCLDSQNVSYKYLVISIAFVVVVVLSFYLDDDYAFSTLYDLCKRYISLFLVSLKKKTLFISIEFQWSIEYKMIFRCGNFLFSG